MSQSINTDNKAYKKIVFINLVLYAITVGINYASAMGFINGNSQSQVSKAFPTMITPSGFAFSIWGLIYVLIFLSIILPLFKKTDIAIDSLVYISPIFWISCLINIGWTFAFSYKIIWLSAILIIVLWVNILDILLKLKSIKKETKGLIDIAFGFYAGWLGIASLVNFVAFLVSVDFAFFGNEKIFCTVFLALFIMFSTLLQKSHKSPVYNLSIVWAFYAILKKLNFEDKLDPMSLMLTAGMIMLVITTILSNKKIKFKL